MPSMMFFPISITLIIAYNTLSKSCYRRFRKFNENGSTLLQALDALEPTLINDPIFKVFDFIGILPFI